MADTPSNSRQPTLAQLPVENQCRENIFLAYTPRDNPDLKQTRQKTTARSEWWVIPPIFSYLKICSSVSLSVSPY